MLKKRGLIFLSFGLSFCTTKQQETKLKNLNTCENALQTFKDEQTLFFIEQDPTEYFWGLSDKQFSALDIPKELELLEKRNLALLAIEIRKLMDDGVPFEKASIQVREEFTAESQILHEARQKWLAQHKVESIIRSSYFREAIGLSDSKLKLSQKQLRTWVEEKLDAFDPMEAFYRFAPERHQTYNFIMSHKDIAKYRTLALNGQTHTLAERMGIDQQSALDFQKLSVDVANEGKLEDMEALVKIYLSSESQKFLNRSYDKVSFVIDYLNVMVQESKAFDKTLYDVISYNLWMTRDVAYNANERLVRFLDNSEAISTSRHSFYETLIIHDFFAQPVEAYAKHLPRQ